MKFPEIDKSLINVYKSVENVITTKINRIVDLKRKVDGKKVTGVDVYPIGEYWKVMDKQIQTAKQAKQKMEALRLQF